MYILVRRVLLYAKYHLFKIHKVLVCLFSLSLCTTYTVYCTCAYNVYAVLCIDIAYALGVIFFYLASTHMYVDMLPI